MNTFFKYLGAFCLLTIAASLAFCSMGVYNGMQTANRLLAGADNYTCRQFAYDMSQPDADKFPALAIATIAYGSGDDATAEEKQDEIMSKGMSVAVAKVNALCKGQPDSRVLNLFAQSLVSPTMPVVSTTISVSATQPKTE